MVGAFGKWYGVDVVLGMFGGRSMSDHAFNALFALMSLTAAAVFANIFVTSFWARRIIRAIESHRQI
jgi:hypothetical protein